MNRKPIHNWLALLLISSFLYACQNPQEVLESLEDPDISEEVEVPAGFDFNMNQSHTVQVLARKTNGFPMEQVLFRLYTDNPASGGALIGKGVTDESGALTLQVDVSNAEDQVFLQPSHEAWEAGKMIDLLEEDVQSIWEWDISEESTAPPSEPATTESSCQCPPGGREITWPVGTKEYVVPQGSIQCISSSIVRTFDKIVVEGSLYITNDAIVKFPGDTFHVASTGLLDICKGAGISFGGKVTEFEGDIRVDGWLEDCNASRIRYQSLSLGDGAVVAHFGNQLYLPEEGVAYHGTEKDGYIFFGGINFNGTVSGSACPEVEQGVKWRIFGESERFIEPTIICFSHCKDCEGLDNLSCGGSSVRDLYHTYNGAEEEEEVSEEICGNGIDDDGNGLIDCEDGACSAEADCERVDSDTDGIPDEKDDFPQDPSLAFSTYIPSQTGFHTYAFETGWPTQGDFDYNDLVVDINHEYLRNATGGIEKLIFHAVVRAAGETGKVAMGISLDDLAASQVASVSGTQSPSTAEAYNGVEAGQEHPVVILFEDAHNLLGTGTDKRVNSGGTESFDAPVASLEVTITFKNALESVGTCNPFIFTNGKRGQETHLKGYNPTQKVDDSFFGIGDDASQGTDSYQNKNGLPWALLFPERFAYPVEGTAIWDSYEKFHRWTQNYGRQEKSWFNISQGNPDRIVDN